MPPGDRPRAAVGPRPQALERCAGHARSRRRARYATDAAAAGRRRTKGGDGRARALRRDAAQAARGLSNEVAITKVQESAAVSTRNGFEDKISAGIVFTGGTSKMEGVVELAESIFQTSVRLGIPSKFKGMETILQNPIYSTSIGLIEHGNKQINNEMLAEQNLNLFSKLLRIVKSEY